MLEEVGYVAEGRMILRYIAFADPELAVKG
jgi:hypothetical protein